MSFTNDLLVAGVSAVMGKKVMTQTQFDEYKKTPEGRNAVSVPLSADDAFKASHYELSLRGNFIAYLLSEILKFGLRFLQPYRRIYVQPPTGAFGLPYHVFVHPPSGQQILVTIYHCNTIADLKRAVAREVDIPTYQIRLTFCGRELNNDDKTLAECAIDNRSNVHVLQRSDDQQPIRTCGRRYQVFVHPPSGQQILVTIYHCSTIADLKRVIAREIDIPTDQMRLTFCGRELNNDDKTLAECAIGDNSTVHVLLRIRGGGPDEVVFIFQESDLDPEFNYDFSTLSDDGTVYYRGPHEYHRPYGWKRYALKVKGKYKNNTWLGDPGMRTNSTSGEWSVSYHGTSQSGAQGISKEGYKMGTRFLYGKGIYSSPSIAVAEQFAQVFTHNGTTYKIVFQNRCNPNSINVVPASKCGACDDYWITEREEDTRPYGMCFKELGSTSSPPPNPTSSPPPSPTHTPNAASNSDSWCTVQ